MTEDLEWQVRRLVQNCTIKRELLLEKGLSYAKLKKALTVISATLAILSASAITTVIVKYFGNNFLQIFAAVSSASSGIISIIITLYYGEDDTSKAFEGSSKYLTLREKANRLFYKPNSTDEEIYKELELLQNDYTSLDQAYSKFIVYTSRTSDNGQYSRHWARRSGGTT